MISMGEALEERVPAAALKNITILLNYSAFWREDPRWAKAQGGKEPGLGAPAQPLPPTPTYHYGSSRLGPQGLEHLPLHQEVGQEDDRRDLCDGGHGKGPLWGETQAAGPPSGPRAAIPSGPASGAWGAVGKCGSSGEKRHPPHTHTPWLNFRLSTEMLTTPCSQSQVSAKASWSKALGCPLVSRMRTAGDDQSPPSLTRTHLARKAPRGQGEGVRKEDASSQGHTESLTESGLDDSPSAARPFIRQESAIPSNGAACSRPSPAAKAGGPGAPRSGYSLPTTSWALDKCPCTPVLDLSCLAGNTGDPDPALHQR